MTSKLQIALLCSLVVVVAGTLSGCGSGASTDKMGMSDHMGDAKMGGSMMGSEKMSGDKMGMEAPMNDAMEPMKMDSDKMNDGKMGNN
jgi:hypothetical protein